MQVNTCISISAFVNLLCLLSANKLEILLVYAADGKAHFSKSVCIDRTLFFPVKDSTF
jgi:hypothetical protein